MTYQLSQCSQLTNAPVLPSFRHFITVLTQQPDEGFQRLCDTNESGSRDMASPHSLALKAPPVQTSAIQLHDQSESSTGIQHQNLAPSHDQDQIRKGSLTKPLKGNSLAAFADGRESMTMSERFDGINNIVRPAKKQRNNRNQPMDPNFTRDGMPRKRLAQACERCRTQKIKCRLQGNECILCIKQGLECVFTRRTKQATSPREQSTSPPRYIIPSPSSRHSSARSSGISVSRQKDSTMSIHDSNLSSDTLQHSMHLKEILSPVSSHESPARSVRMDRSTENRKPLSFDELSVDIDPYFFDADLCRRYMQNYFRFLNQSPYYLLVLEPFTKWLEKAEKTTSEKTLLYAIMAAGALFSEHQNHEDYRISFTRIARDGLDRVVTPLAMSTIHALLVMSTLSAYVGDLQHAASDSLCALQYSYGLQLNQETAYSRARHATPYVQDIHLVECCRRTFWLAYIRSSMSAVCLPATEELPILHGELRLPCSDVTSVSRGPLLLNDGFYEQHIAEPVSDMALLCQASAIMGKIFRKSSSLAQEIDTGHAAVELRDQARIGRAITQWSTLRDGSISNGRQLSLEFRLIDSFMSLARHRYQDLNSLNPSEAGHHYREAQSAARQLLMQLCAPEADLTAPLPIDPFVSFAIFTAFDSFISAGYLSDVSNAHQRLHSGHLPFMALATRVIASLSDRAAYSKLARTQLQAIEKRLMSIKAQSNAAGAWRSRGFYFRDSIDSDSGRSRRRDLIYELGRHGVANALALDGRGNYMLEMKLMSVS